MTIRVTDEESAMRRTQEYFKANLNNQIALINTEKTDFDINTITADDDHYVFGGDLLEIPNRDFVNFVITDITTKTNGNSMISEISMMIEVVIANAKKPSTYFKSLRYMRAVYQTALGYGLSTSEVDGFQVTKALPMATTSLRREMMISGVECSFAIG